MQHHTNQPLEEGLYQDEMELLGERIENHPIAWGLSHKNEMVRNSTWVVLAIIMAANGEITPFFTTTVGAIFLRDVEKIDTTPCFAGGFVMSAFMLGLLWSIANESKLPPSLRLLDSSTGLAANIILAIGCEIGSVVVGQLIIQGNLNDTRLIQSSALGAGVIATSATVAGTLFYYCAIRKPAHTEEQPQNEVVLNS
jgi:hypothetical protein